MGLAYEPKHTTSSVKHGGRSVTAANRTGSLVFIDGVTFRCTRIHSEMYRVILSTQIHPNATKLSGRCYG